MRGELNQGKSLQYLTALPDDYDPKVKYPLVIMLHGFGANMRDLAGLAPALERVGYVYVCPNAPMPIDLGHGQVGFGWAPPRGQASPEDIRNAERLVGEFVDEVAQKYAPGPGQTLLLGFSQGGGMTLRCGLNRPKTLAGLIALSASLPDPDSLNDRLPPPNQRKQPVFIAHGINDGTVTVDIGRKVRDFLNSKGYSPEYHEYPMAHEISIDVINDLIPWMRRTLPPLKKAA